MRVDRHRRVFALATLLGTTGLLLAGAGMATALASVHHAGVGGAAGAGDFSIGVAELSYPRVNGAGAVLLALATGGALVAAVALRASWRQLRAYRRFRARLTMIGRLASDAAVTVIADPQPQAFCAGYLRPEIYVSERTLELLSEPELAAVLAHEHRHRRARDPLRFALGRVLSDAVFFLPALAPLYGGYADLAEVSADRAAAAEVGRRPLARALLAMERTGHPAVAGFSAARVDSLLGEPVRLRLPLRRLGTSLVATTGLGVAIWLLSRGAAAQATFNLPIVSPRPCIAVAMALPLLAGLLKVTR